MAGVHRPITAADAMAVASLMLATGRTIPPEKWVDRFRERAEGSLLDTMF